MSRRALSLAFAASLAAGCAPEEMYRFAYEEGQRYTCRQAAEHKPNESMEEFRCMTETHAAGDRLWEEYREDRERELR
ncbi:MAG TPA: hypothetical protein VIC61_02235, partial [Gammaproteobacteria bacterium]